MVSRSSTVHLSSIYAVLAIAVFLKWILKSASKHFSAQFSRRVIAEVFATPGNTSEEL